MEMSELINRLYSALKKAVYVCMYVYIVKRSSFQYPTQYESSAGLINSAVGLGIPTLCWLMAYCLRLSKEASIAPLLYGTTNILYFHTHLDSCLQTFFSNTYAKWPD
jgi:hypothetical protein